MNQQAAQEKRTDAVRWWKNGDHPDDRVGEILVDPLGGPDYERLEGAVVRFWRHPDYPGDMRHGDMPGTQRPACQAKMHDHGWIDETGTTVCPGDWLLTPTSR